MDPVSFKLVLVIPKELFKMKDFAELKERCLGSLLRQFALD
jgi:hypothetical protein